MFKNNMIANGKKQLRKKSEIVAALSDELNLSAIKAAIEHIRENPELQRIKEFTGNCDYVLQHITLAEKKTADEIEKYAIVYSEILATIRMNVEDNGIPRKGHLDDTAKNLLQKLESKELSHLLDDPQTAISYGKVKAHYRDWQHSQDYEGHLHNLYAIVKKEERNIPLLESKLIRNLA